MSAVPLPTPLAVTLHTIEEVRRRQVRPIATYRLQFHRDFTLRDAAALVPYLHDLGISHVYCSPYLRAKAGSTHGYDICDHAQFNPELGGEAAYRDFVAALAAHGMGHILDMVPNHMAASTQNPWWYDVLENGPNSPYAPFFDIDWHPVKKELADKLLLPILGKQYGEVLEEGQLKLEYRDGSFFVGYFDNELPIGPKAAVPLLQHRIGDLQAELGPDHLDFIELQSIITALDHLPPQSARDLQSVRERQREKEVIKRRLRELTEASEAVRRHIARGLADYNGRAGDPSSFDLLARLLDEQAYRLAHWRAAFDEINYRRFFDINELAAIAMEIPEVFWRSHVLVRALLAEGSLSGLRIDHIDGLFGPERYLLRLQWAYLADLGRGIHERLSAEAHAAAPPDEAEPATGENNGMSARHLQSEWLRAAPEVMRLCSEQLGLPAPDFEDMRAILGPEVVAEIQPASPAGEPAIASPRPRGVPPLYVLTEKILGPDEPLPESWPIAGTTGYDFLNALNGLFVLPQSWDDLVRAYQRFVGDATSYEQVVLDSKRLILRIAMASELLMLAHRLNQVSEQHRRTRDLTLNMLRLATREVLTSFPVYRIYPRREGISDRDRRFVDLAVTRARRQNPTFDPAVFEFLRNVLLLNHPDGLTPQAISEREILAGKFQQVTSPVMAKGVEDTAFYVWVPLGSVNEVGGDPRRPTTTLDQFQAQNLERRAQYPLAMLATSTHDTKRSEDLRARLNVLSEMPREWRNCVQRWSRLNRRWRREVDGEPAPSLRDEYLYYQSLVGIWPLASPGAAERGTLVERLQAYMEKATHEAKQRTSWINPSPAYDEAVREFVAQTLRDAPQNRFVADVQTFCERILDAGQLNSLAQVALKLLSPGVPDIYQGQELWNFSLVDPDNRRPVDFDFVRQALAEITAWEHSAGGEAPSRVAELGKSLRDPRLKLLVTQRLLALRRTQAALWTEGEYVPLTAAGPSAEHLVAFGWRNRNRQRIELLVAVPRFSYKLLQVQQGRAAALKQACGEGAPTSISTWDDTSLAWPENESGLFRHVFTGRLYRLESPVIDVGMLFDQFPIAVLSIGSETNDHITAK